MLRSDDLFKKRTGDLSKVKNRDLIVGAGLGIILFAALLVWTQMPHVSGKTENPEKEKIVICVNASDIQKDTAVSYEISVEDSREKLMSYNEDGQTLLYINQDGQIIERALTGEIICNIENEELTEIRNLQYMPEQQKISFIYDDSLYCYDRINEQLEKIIDRCGKSNWRNTYWWNPSGGIYFVDYDEDMQQNNLYFQEKTQERILIEKGIESFCASKDGTKLYGIQMYVVPNMFGFNMQYRIVEINLENGTSSILKKLNSDNFTLENIDNRFLLYIEESNEKQMSKVYQINLSSGKVKCIYRTNKKVIGIIEE